MAFRGRTLMGSSPAREGLACDRCSRPPDQRAIVIRPSDRSDIVHLVQSRLGISWHRTSATSAVGRIVPDERGSTLATITVDGDWYLLPGTVSASLPHRFEGTGDSVTFLCLRRGSGVEELPAIVVNGERST